MSVLQSRIQEIRYLHRQNIEEESKIIGNYYRDVIRQYGINCNYYKIKVPYMDKFRKILDENAMILHAYGQDPSPDYSVSADMITYMEVENDIMNLNKYGIIPDMNVNFYFDSNDFACQLACCLGRLKEYPIKETKFVMEVPPSDEIPQYVEFDKYKSDEIAKEYFGQISAKVRVPYTIFENNGFPLKYSSDVISGHFSFNLGPYELEKEYCVQCHPYEHGELNISFPVNDSIYKTLDRHVETREYVDQMLFMKYSVLSVQTFGKIKYVLNGKLYGSVLFRDTSRIGKYKESIHPDVGDIVMIDFPDENNRQQFEITECNDKNLGNDGINPLLHRYVWKCKARRYVSSGEDFPEKNQSNERWSEKIDLLDKADEDIARKISNYDEQNSDGVYGGYERQDVPYDIRRQNVLDYDKCVFIDDGSYENVFTFFDGSRLVTDGYEMYYVDASGDRYMLTMVQDDRVIWKNLVQSGLQYLKSTDDALFFVNFEGRVQRICEDESITSGEVQTCLNSLVDATYGEQDNNKEGDFYYKFNDSNTVLMSINGTLYCRFGNKNGKTVKIAFKKK